MNEHKNEHKILAFQLSLPVRWADMDVNAHVNNTRFFTYFESARLAWLESVRTRAERNGEGCVVAQTSCTYHQPISYPETLLVRLYAGAPGRSSFTTYYELLCEGDESVTYADGQAVMVWVDRASGKSLPIPDYLLSVLAPANTAVAPQ